jgi:hypothetical protein
MSVVFFNNFLHNKVHGVLKVCHTKITEELGIRVRKITDKMLGCSAYIYMLDLCNLQLF